MASNTKGGAKAPPFVVQPRMSALPRYFTITSQYFDVFEVPAGPVTSRVTT